MIKFNNFLFTLMFLVCAISIFGQGIEFEHIKWQDALAKAKKENKLLFVDAYAKWCGPCKRMAKYEFVKEEVGEVYNKNFINLKLDMESKNGRTFGAKYPVSAYPTMFFLSGDGKVVKKVVGGHKGDQLIGIAHKALKNFDSSGKFKEKYEKGDHSYETVYAYVDALNKSGKPSLKISNDFLRNNKDLDRDKLARFLFVATVDADSKIFERMVEMKDEVIQAFGAEAYDEKIKSACKNTMMSALEYDERSLLEEAVSKAKKHMTKDGGIYASELLMTYSLAMGDKDNYRKSVQKMTKHYLKSNPDRIKRVVDDIHKKFFDDDSMLKLAVKLSKKYYKKEKSVKSALTYIQALLKMEDFDKAAMVVEEAIDEAREAGEATKPLMMMKKLIDQKI